MYSPVPIDLDCTNRFTFNNVTEVLIKKPTVTGTLNVSQSELVTANATKLTYVDTNIGNFGTGDFSVVLRVKVGSFVSQSSGTINAIIAKGTSESTGFSLHIRSDNKLYAYTVATGGKIYDTAINDGLYHHIVITRSGTTLIGYVDGVQRLTVTCSSATVNTGSFQIGGDSTTDKYSACNYRLVELYNKALSAGEVLALYSNNKFSVYNPVMNINSWIKGTGTYIEQYNTTINSIVPVGQKVFKCNIAGTLAYPSKQTYGTWEYSVNSANLAQSIVQFISGKIESAALAAVSGFGVVLRIDGTVRLIRDLVGTLLFATTAGYTSKNTWYRIKVINLVTGQKTVYIKGGVFGNNYTLVTVIVGSNPITDNTYTTNNFMVLDLDANDLISDIRFYPYIK